MSGPVEIVLIVAAVGYVLARRLAGEPAQGRRMLILPAVLCLVGLSSVSAATAPWSLAFLLGGLAVSVLFGVLRGATVQISGRDGVAFVRYTWVTVALWAANIAIKLGSNALFGLLDPHDATSVSSSLMLTLGGGLLAEGLVILYRATRSGYGMIWQRSGSRPAAQPQQHVEQVGQQGPGPSTDRGESRPSSSGPVDVGLGRTRRRARRR